MVEDIHCIIGGASAGQRGMADKSGISDAAYIDTIGVVIVLTPVFAGHLADAVYGSGLRHRVLRTMGFRCMRSEDGDAAGPEHLASPFSGNFQYTSADRRVGKARVSTSRYRGTHTP